MFEDDTIITSEVDTKKLKYESDKITNDIINETDPDSLSDLIDLFEQNQKKKNIARVNRMSNLLDLVDTEVETRLKNNPELIRSDMLLDVMKIAQQSMTTSKQMVDQAPTTTKPLVGNDNLLVGEELSIDSRKKVLEAVNMILESSKNIELNSSEIKELE